MTTMFTHDHEWINIEVPEADYPQLASLKSCSDYLLPKFNK